MPFDLTSEVTVKRDSDGKIRKLSHPRKPFGGSPDGAAALEADSAAATVHTLADQYVREVLPALELAPEFADSLEAAVNTSAVTEGEGPKLRFLEERIAEEQATVSYAQTALGLPVWHAGFSVQMRGAPFNVVSSQNGIQYDIDVEPPATGAPFMPELIDAPILAKLLGVPDSDPQPTINAKSLLIYQHDQDDRGNAISIPTTPDVGNIHAGCPTLSPLSLPASIENGRYYVVTEVLFTLERPGWEELNWGAFIEPMSGAALRVEAFVGCVNGHVLLRDPLTESGDTSISPDAANDILDALRESVILEGLDAPNPRQELRGEFIRLTNVSAPNVAAPTKAPGEDFEFTVSTDEFAAVNAYYHCDRGFRLLEELGFNVRDFFNGTVFPVRVDHRATIGGETVTVNAQAPGNALRNGSDGFRFALLAPNSTVGMAASARVTLHEFGHAVLYGPLHSPNFPFAHSIGDTLAAIVLDPMSQAPDRGRTFPWTIIKRRHDYMPASGFAWGGSRDNRFVDRAGYEREQILSSTLFRYYRSLGGAHRDLAVRDFASRYALYLIFDTIRSLSPITPPADAEAFADALMETDLLVRDLDGYPGGTTHKIVRWAFERQGLYQPAGAPRPVTRPGAPPDVDIYLDDGRDGGYEPQDGFLTNAPDIWCRNDTDGGLDHEDPQLNETSHIYLRIHNRGSLPANNIEVRAFVSKDDSDQVWPNDWQALVPSSIRLATPLAAGREEIVGPFTWRPGAAGGFSLLAEVDCPDDPSIASHTVRGPVSAVQLVHLDNNLAIRNVTVVANIV